MNIRSLIYIEMEDAEVAVFMMNSAAEVCKDVVDQLRAKGIKAGLFPQI